MLLPSLLIVAAAAAAPGPAAPLPVPPAAAAPAAPAAAAATGDQTVVLGAITVDARTRTVLATGYVNQVKGPVELLACGGEKGKTHESVFVMQCRPQDLQAGLLLLGAKAGPPMPERGKGPPAGSRLRLDVEWTQDGATNRADAGRFLRLASTSNHLGGCDWIFTGSTFDAEGDFTATIEESYVATYWDPWAVVNLGAAEGADDERLVVNEAVVPPRLTDVRFLFRLP